LPLLKENHPQPGQRYTGTTMTRYLLNYDGSSVNGEQVGRMLQVAFQRKLLFTVSDSGRSGGYKVVPCDDVSHLTLNEYVLMIYLLMETFLKLEVMLT